MKEENSLTLYREYLTRITIKPGMLVHHISTGPVLWRVNHIKKDIETASVTCIKNYTNSSCREGEITSCAIRNLYLAEFQYKNNREAINLLSKE